MTVRLAGLVPTPPAVVIDTTPVVAPFGTTTVADVALVAVGTAVTFPENVTSVAPVKYVPAIVMVAPSAHEVGENEVIVGTP